MNVVTKLLHLGIHAGLSPHEQRVIRATNFLNLFVAVCLLIGYTNYFFLRENFPFTAVTGFFLLSLVSLGLSWRRRTKEAFLLFTINVNLSVLFINLYYPRETGPYLYYYPLIVSVVLLNNPTLRDPLSLVHIVVSVVCFLLSMWIYVPGFRMEGLTDVSVTRLWYYNAIISFAITAVLAVLLTRIISKQNVEITRQNDDLLVTREELNVSLKEKEMLLAELHHRVKNNLAIITGLLNLQEDSASSQDARRILSDSRHRIMSMAMVHRMLYGSSDVKWIDLGTYCSELINELFSSYNLHGRVTIDAAYDSVKLPVSKSVPLGLILNEVLTNSIKYVYTAGNGAPAKFFVRISDEGAGRVGITMRDSGAGFPRDFNNSGNDTLGIHLIKMLTEQLDGTVRFSNDHGARIDLTFTR